MLEVPLILLGDSSGVESCPPPAAVQPPHVCIIRPERVRPVNITACSGIDRQVKEFSPVPSYSHDDSWLIAVWVI